MRISLQIKIVNRTKERQVFEEIMLKLDRVENDNLPQVKLGKNEVRIKKISHPGISNDMLKSPAQNFHRTSYCI